MLAMTKELRRRGHACSERTVRSVMQQADLRVQRRRPAKRLLAGRPGTTAQQRGPYAPNLLAADFRPGLDREVFVSDITQIKTSDGVLHVAVVMRLGSRRIIGLAMTNQPPDSLLVQRALADALSLVRPSSRTLLHSDRGSQYSSSSTQAFSRARGLTLSMSGSRRCGDNAVCESFFASLKREIIPARLKAMSMNQARATVREWIQDYYNVLRPHSSLAFHSPLHYEQLAASS